MAEKVLGRTIAGCGRHYPERPNAVFAEDNCSDVVNVRKTSDSPPTSLRKASLEADIEGVS